MFVVSISDLEEAERHEVILDNHPLLHEYVDIFSNEILGMSPECNIDFCIDLIPIAEPISQAPYHMTTQELSELIL